MVRLGADYTRGVRSVVSRGVIIVNITYLKKRLIHGLNKITSYLGQRK